MTLNTKQKIAFSKVTEGKNLYIGGPGGVGKSYLIHHIMTHFRDSTVLLAPTGISALNINGATLNSVFRLPLHVLTKRDATPSQKVLDLFDPKGPVKRIVLDEISTARCDKFTVIDHMLRKARRINKPFGGIQVIVVGDFYQIPPVLTNNEKKIYNEHYSSPFAFGGDTWAEAQFEYIELDEIMRQQDKTFIDNLQLIRQKLPGYEKAVKFFNEIGSKNLRSVMDEDPIFICTTNTSADTINADNYEGITDKEHSYYGTLKGRFNVNSIGAPMELKLKYGTKVILTANTPSFKNGQIGYVIKLLEEAVVVLLEDTEEEIVVKPHVWKEIEYSNSGGELNVIEVGSYEQLPIKHGWAITIHKCQGLTLSNCVIDFGRGCFVSGQGYVALSRIKTLEGMGIMGNISCSDIIVDKEVTEFYNNGCRGIGLF